MVTTLARKPRRDLVPRTAQRERGETLTVRVWESDRGGVYFVVPRRLGTAVERNRLRRQLRELSRRSLLAPGLAVVISANSLPVEFQKLEEEYRGLLSRLGALSG